MSEPRKSATTPVTGTEPAPDDAVTTELAEEVGGRGGLEPTRYGDWEKNGRCIDF